MDKDKLINKIKSALDEGYWIVTKHYEDHKLIKEVKTWHPNNSIILSHSDCEQILKLIESQS